MSQIAEVTLCLYVPLALPLALPLLGRLPAAPGAGSAAGIERETRLRMEATDPMANAIKPTHLGLVLQLLSAPRVISGQWF